MLVKYLLVLLVVGLGVWMLSTKFRRRDAAEPRVKPPPAKAGVPAPQDMVACAHCGLHLPAADAVLGGSRVYCSEAHRALGLKDADQA